MTAAPWAVLGAARRWFQTPNRIPAESESISDPRPALRQRTKGIPRLVRHFTALYSQRMNKRIDAVILSPESTLRAPTSELERFEPYKESNAPINVLEEVERDHILRALEASNWVISGAATRLGMKRTSLAYRMKKLSVRRPATVPQKSRDGSSATDN